MGICKLYVYVHQQSLNHPQLIAKYAVIVVNANIVSLKAIVREEMMKMMMVLK